jgi:hypothetical protein
LFKFGVPGGTGTRTTATTFLNEQYLGDTSSLTTGCLSGSSELGTGGYAWTYNDLTQMGSIASGTWLDTTSPRRAVAVPRAMFRLACTRIGKL